MSGDGVYSKPPERAAGAAVGTPAGAAEGARAGAAEGARAGAARELSAAERALAAIWCDLLGVADVGPGDEFFALGGTSLEALRVSTAAAETFGVVVPARLLFEEPTLRGLAAAVERLVVDDVRAAGEPAAGPASHPVLALLSPAGRRAAAGLSAAALASLDARLRALAPPGIRGAPVLPRGDRRLLPLSWQQLRAWRRELRRAGDPAANLPTAVRVEGPLSAPAFDQAVAELARRQELLRARIVADGDGEPQQRIDPPRRVVLPLVDLSGLPPARAVAVARELAAAEAERPFGLRPRAAEAELPFGWRARLVRLGPRDHVVALTLHDVVADPWSVDVAGYQALTTYGDHAAGRPPRIRGPAVNYCEYALHQRDWVESAAGRSQLAYWRERLAGAPPPDLTPASSAADLVSTDIGSELAERLHALARSRDATLFMVLVAAVQALLGRVTGRTAVAVGCPAAGRVHRALDAVIGPFLNPLVLLGDLSGDPRFDELLDATRVRALEAYANQELPYERLVSELAPERHALFDVAVTFHQRADPPPEPGGVAVQDFARARPRTMLPVEVAFIERDDALEAAVTHLRTPAATERARVLLGGLPELLARAAERPGARLSELPLPTAGTLAHAQRADV